MNKLLSLYTFGFSETVAYMLQVCEYDRKEYLRWLHRTNDFSKVMHRKRLDKTIVATAILLFMRAGTVVLLTAAAAVLVYAILNENSYALLAAMALSLFTPILLAYLVVIPVAVAKRFVMDPRAETRRLATQHIFENHTGTKIVVAGSFGKTTMKELLATVLSEAKTVASTPGNKNVAAAHYDFAASLTGKEDILVVELGEGRPGDVEGFTKTLMPDIAVITGLAPAHLDAYGTIERAGLDIFSVAKALKTENVYVNSESSATKEFTLPGYVVFGPSGVDGWNVTDVSIDLEGTRFIMTKSGMRISVESGLIGAHLVGVLATTVAIANRLGLTKNQIESAMKRTTPFEHRMQPYRLGGAWIIDDAYNGNIQGVQAGTQLLASLQAKRKIYVSPGLVEQGDESERVHNEMGRLIAHAKPDVVVLMRNSVCEFIEDGLKTAGFNGQLLIHDNPLSFYTNLDQFVAAGDLVLLQNDWSDNYQ